MKILLKSSLNEKELNYKTNLNKNIEIQLLDELLKYNLDSEEVYKKIKKANLNIEVIHTPLINHEDIDLLSIVNEKDKYEMFYKTCILAEYIAEKENKEIIVVIHNSNSIESYKELNLLFKIENLLKEILNICPKIKIAIENVIPLILSNNKAKGKTAFLGEGAELSNYLNSNGLNGKIGTVLDICHATITINILKCCGTTISLEDFFKWNKDEIMLIHLANTKGSGYLKGEHGCAFSQDKEDLIKLEEFYKLYLKYKYKCPITIEVYEEYYCNCINYINTYNNFMNIKNSLK